MQKYNIQRLEAITISMINKWLECDRRDYLPYIDVFSPYSKENGAATVFVSLIPCAILYNFYF